MDDAAKRRELRHIARRLHPDVGGDPDLYVAAVARLERESAGAGRTSGRPVRVRHAVGVRALALRARRRWRRWARDRFARRRRRAQERLSRRGAPRRRPAHRPWRSDPSASG